MLPQWTLREALKLSRKESEKQSRSSTPLMLKKRSTRAKNLEEMTVPRAQTAQTALSSLGTK
jgi:hypothetical protein